VPTTLASARSRLADELERSIRHQLTADVPIGVFLSGGVDSSLLALHASRGLGPDRVEAFTMAFADGSYDESVAAAQVARGLGVRHTVIRWNHLNEALDTIVSRISEPIADPAILPTYVLAKEASKRVKVILSGEGADELFGGYPTYVGHRLIPWFRRLPSPLRSCISAGVNRLPASAGKTPFEYLAKRFIASSSRGWLDRHVTWFGTGLPKLIRQPVWTTESLRDELPLGSDELASAMLLDYRTYLRDNLLVKVDRATMLASVEARAPFLDRDLTSLAFSLPSRMRVHGLTTKWILKRAAAKWLPHSVVYRRKRGFSVPVAGWLNVELRSEVDRVLDRRKIDEEGLIDGQAVERLVREHREGVANHGRGLWALLVLRRWLEHWMYDQSHEVWSRRRVDSARASS
jgi:asparagine synthase (glutamine-hydrolysing)